MKLTALVFTTTLLTMLAAFQAADTPKEMTNSIGMKLMRVEAGSFLMGQDGPPADYQTKAVPSRPTSPTGCADGAEEVRGEKLLAINHFLDDRRKYRAETFFQ